MAKVPYIDFLDSETISLQADNACRPFNVHRKLLGSKCRSIIAAFEGGFEEGRKGTYIFQDTSEGTVARFIEWLYTGDYPILLRATQSREGEATKEKRDGVQNREANTTTVEKADLTSESHPPLVHVRLYVFSSIYIIPDLQKLAFERTTAYFTDLNKPDSHDKQLTVIAALRISFQRLPTSDPLLDWLAQYAAYSVQQLQLQKEFHDLLREISALGSQMVRFLNPAYSPPWGTEQKKSKKRRF
ncbi:hypothetical protein BJX76DRAFT_133444 [Aspergillus varians]